MLSIRISAFAAMAGEFAKAVDAKKLVLTHFSGKLEGALCGFNVSELQTGDSTVSDSTHR